MIEKYENGDWEEFELVNGKKHGKVTYYFSSGLRDEYTYINGLKQGKAVRYYPKGAIEEYNYINGVVQGKAVCYYTDDSIEESNYIDGLKQGKAVCRYPNGSVKEYYFIDGILAKPNKKQEIDLKIEKCEKLCSEFKMKYTEMNIDRDKNEFEKMETNIRFLSYIKSNELTKDQIEKLSQLKKIKDLATHKITVYGKELDKMPKEREDIKNDRMFTPIVCLGGAIAGVYFIFKHFSGLITMIAIPIVFAIASGIISSVKQETDKKEKELNLKQKKINSIINVAHRIDKILSPFIKI